MKFGNYTPKFAWRWNEKSSLGFETKMIPPSGQLSYERTESHSYYSSLSFLYFNYFYIFIKLKRTSHFTLKITSSRKFSYSYIGGKCREKKNSTILLLYRKNLLKHSHWTNLSRRKYKSTGASLVCYLCYELVLRTMEFSGWAFLGG